MPTTDHPVMVLSRALQRSSNDAPSSSQCNGLDAAILVTEPATEQSADESAKIVHGHL